MVKRVLIGVMAAVFLAAGIVKADNITELRKQMEQQYEQMRQMQNKLIELEAAQKQQGVTVQKMEESGTVKLPDTLKWIEKINLYGDFRYRYEHISWDDNSGNSSNRDRNRIRARIGMKANVNDEFAFDLRLATGSSDPVSTNQTLGAEDEKEFGSRDIWLDRAYVSYTPACVDGLTVLAGKFGTPFYRPGDNQLIWDDDLNPEGVALQYTKKVSDSMSAFVNIGYMQVEENKNGDYGLELFGIQGGMKHTFDDSTLTYGASYFDYANTKGHAALGNGFEGNSNTGGVYDFDYKLLEAFGDYSTKVGELPVSLYGDYVVNTASSVKEDTGWLVGTTLGKAKATGSSQFAYEYRDLDRDCTVGTFNDSDFVDGGTSGKGHKFSYKYQLAKNTQLAATYFCADAGLGSDDKKDDPYKRLQLDFIVKF